MAVRAPTAAASPRRGWRRGARWIVRGAVGAIALIVGAMVVMLIVLHTAWGRERLRRIAEDELDGALGGPVRIGSLEGSVLGELVAHDVVIDGADGQTISIATLRIDVALRPLLGEVVRVDRLIADDVVVAWRGGGAPPSSPRSGPSPSRPSSWELDLRDVQVHRARVAVEVGARSIELGGIELTAAARRVDGDWTARVDGQASWCAGCVPGLAASGDLAINATLAPGQPIAATVRGTVEGAPLVAAATLDRASRRARGVIAAPQLVAAGLGRGGGLARFDLGAADGDGALLDRVRGTITLVGSGDVEPVAVRGAAITATVAGRTAHVVATAVGDGGAHLDGEGDVALTGAALTLERAQAHGAVDRVGPASGDRIALAGAVRFAIARAHGPLWPARALDVDATVDADGPALGGVRARTLHATVDARGLFGAAPGPAPVTVVATAAELRLGDLALGTVTVTARPAAGGGFAVTARSQPRAPWSIDADARIVPGAVTRIALGHHGVGGPDERWTGAGGVIEIGHDQAAARGIHSSGPHGALAIDDVTYQRDGGDAGDLVAAGAATGLDVGALARVIGADPGWQGRLDGTARVQRRGGRWTGTVAMTGHRVARDATAPPIDGHVDLRVRAGALELHATAAAGAAGTGAIDAAVTPPVRLTDLAAWRRLERAALGSVRVRAQHVELAAVARIAGAPVASESENQSILPLRSIGSPDEERRAPFTETRWFHHLSGTLDGDVTLTATDAHGELHLVRAGLAVLPGSHALDADVTIAGAARGAITATGTSAVAGLALVDATATAVLPEHLIDPAAWRALGAGALVGGAAHVHDVAVDPELLARFGVVAPFRGRVGASIDVGPALASARGELDLRGVRGGPIARPIDVHAEGHLDASRATLAIAASAGGVTLVGATAAAPIHPAEVIARGVASLRATPLTGHVQIDAAPLDAWLAAVGRDDAIGSIIASIELAGTLGAPAATGTLTARDVRAGAGSGGAAPVMRELRVAGGWHDGAFDLDATASEDGGGRLHASARGDAGALARARFTVEAVRFDLAPLALMAPGPLAGARGVLDAELEQRGLDPELGDLHGRLHLTGGSVPISPTIGTLRAADLSTTIAAGTVAVELAAQLGAGTVSLSGSASLATRTTSRARATIALHGVSPIGMHEPSIDGTLDAELRRVDGHWRAELDARDGTIALPDHAGRALHPVGAPADMVFGDARAPRVTRPRAPAAHRRPRDPDLVATLRIGPTAVVSAEAHGVVSGALVLSIGGDAVSIDGTVNTDRADVELLGRRYQVERGAAHFDGSDDPLLDVELGTKLADLTLHAVVTGRASDPAIKLTSDPAIYTEDQLFGFLLGAEPGGAPGGQAGEAASGVTAAAASELIGGVINQLLPVGVNLDVLRYQAATSSTSAAVTIGKWLGRSLFLGASHHIDPHPLVENEYEGDVEWWFGRNWLFHVVAGDRQVGNADVTHRWRW